MKQKIVNSYLKLNIKLSRHANMFMFNQQKENVNAAATDRSFITACISTSEICCNKLQKVINFRRGAVSKHTFLKNKKAFAEVIMRMIDQSGFKNHPINFFS